MKEYEDLSLLPGDFAGQGDEIEAGPHAMQALRVQDPPYHRMIVLVWWGPLLLIEYSTTLGDSGEIDGD